MPVHVQDTMILKRSHSSIYKGFADIVITDTTAEQEN